MLFLDYIIVNYYNISSDYIIYYAYISSYTFQHEKKKENKKLIIQYKV